MPLQDESFGWSVAIAGNQALIGSNAASTPGSAHLFTRSSGTEAWTQTARWASAGAPSRYGYVVDLLHDRAFIGVPGNSGGAVQFVRRNADGSWPTTITQQITSPQQVTNGEFGFAVAASANFLVVGERLGGTGGRAWVYTYNTSTNEYAQPVQITPPNIAATDNYGLAVAIDGARIAVTARYDDGVANEKQDAGAIYFWDRNIVTGQWVQQSFDVRGEVRDALLGHENVDILGNRAVSGAVYADAQPPVPGKVVVIDGLP